MIKTLAGLKSEKENLEQKADTILAGYFGSLKKLANVVANSEPREATTEEINDYDSYLSITSDIHNINQKMRVCGMIMRGLTRSEITKIMGYKSEYTFDGLLKEESQ